MHCKMITTSKLMNTFIMSHNYLFFLVRTLSIYSQEMSTIQYNITNHYIYIYIYSHYVIE